MADFGDAIAALESIIEQRAKAGDAEVSYVAKLLHKGTLKIAQKVGEEAMETALAAAAQPREKVAEEAADLMFHLLVLLKSLDMSSADVAAVLESRHGTSGLDEKASRPPS
ncbi:MAG: phosphoribosyl-ATP diphosphatase [Pseudomonadota bacterium]